MDVLLWRDSISSNVPLCGGRSLSRLDFVHHSTLSKKIYYLAPYRIKQLKNIENTGLEVVSNTLSIQNQYLDDRRCGWICIYILMLMKQTNYDYYKVLSMIDASEIINNK